MMSRLMVMLGLCLWLGSGFTKPVTYQVKSGSTIQFSGTQQGEKFTGSFKSFDALITIDSDSPNQSNFDVTIHLKSTDSHNAERDSALATSAWFDVAHHPDAHFKTVGFKVNATSAQADADLTIRDKTKRIVFPYTFVKTASGATLDAKVRLNRLDYGLGAGEWADDSMVGQGVDVMVHLELAPAAQTDKAHH
jgi:cytochrome b561